MIRVSIVEDDTAFAGLVVWALSKSKNIEVAGKHLTGEEALRDIPREDPDIVLMDIHLPGMDGIECLRRLKRAEPSLKARILMLTGDSNLGVIFDALKAGSAGYFAKDEISEYLRDLPALITALHNGSAVMSPQILRKVIEKFQEHIPRKPFA